MPLNTHDIEEWSYDEWEHEEDNANRKLMEERSDEFLTTDDIKVVIEGLEGMLRLTEVTMRHVDSVAVRTGLERHREHVLSLIKKMKNIAKTGGTVAVIPF